MRERLDKAYTRGWDAAAKAVSTQVADLLERSEREREELEERVEQLEHLQEIAIDIKAFLDAGAWPPQFMREALGDAITSSGLNKEEEGDG